MGKNNVPDGTQGGSVSKPARKLSKSACEKYMQCPASFDYYYNQKIRPIKVGSALMFGSGIDAALNELLLPTLHKDPMQIYRDTVATYELGKITFGKNDYDGELLTEDRCEGILKQLRTHGYTGSDVIGLFTSLKNKLDDGEVLSENQERALDLIYRGVFEAKAELMLEAYRVHVLPNITKVYNVQKATGPGFLDATVEWKGRGKVILDNKTAGRPYPDNAIEYSAQLAMYAAEEQITSVAYVVMIKEIRKNRTKVCASCGHLGRGSHKTCDAIIDGERCNGAWEVTISPEADIQVVHGEVTQEAMAVAAELQREVARAVEAKIFPCNVAQCNSQFGKQCEYKNLKWKNDMTGLQVVERKNK